MKAFRWLSNLGKWFDATLGKVVGWKQVLTWTTKSLDVTGAVTSSLSFLVSDGVLSLPAWQTRMRETIKSEYIRQYLAGRGGLGRMTQVDWGSVGGMLAEQYKYLDGFADDIAAGKLSEAQIAARAKMYVESSKEAYWRAWNRSQDMPTLPAYPGDGTTVCLCITTPESRVLTRAGWMPLDAVAVGNEVLTHRLRWRRVTDVVVKPSRPYHRQAWIKLPGGDSVGCTHDHLWHTEAGWLGALDLEACGARLLCPAGEFTIRGYEIERTVESVVPVVDIGGPMPEGTPLYDLTVEEDHSFLVEGMFAHNTNCRCAWETAFTPGGGDEPGTWEAWWRLGEADHCPTCEDRADDWSPITAAEGDDEFEAEWIGAKALDLKHDKGGWFAPPRGGHGPGSQGGKLERVPKHVWERAAQRTGYRAVKETVARLRGKPPKLPASRKQGWHAPLVRGGETVGFLVGYDSFATTVLGPRMTPKAGSVEVGA